VDAVQVKICGIRDPEAARACAREGVDFAGLNFVPTSRRAVSTETARSLIELLGDTRPVALFRDELEDRVREVAEELGIGWVQLHGEESPAACARLADRDGLQVVKAIPARRASDRALLCEYADAASVLLVDGSRPGSGRTWSWEDLGQALARDDGSVEATPWWLAGGLDPDNVAQGIAALRPAGVDAASGVERAGHTDPARIAAFCCAARSAAAGGSR